MSLVPDRSAPPPWSAGVMSTLAGGKPVSLSRLADQAGVAPGFVQTFLERHPHALLTAGGWVNAVSLFDRVAFTHELSQPEREAGVLSADDDLAAVAPPASEGLPLAAGGEVVGRGLPDLPPALRGDLPAGHGLIGQALVGPPGWLERFRAGDLLRLAIRDGRLEVAVTQPPAGPSAWEHALRDAGAIAAEEALDRYPEDDDRESPAASLARVLAELLISHPKLAEDPLPPLAPILRAAGYETFGGNVGVRGTAWDLGRTRRLGRAEVVAGTRTLRALLCWHDGELPALAVLDWLTTSHEVVRFVADEVERRTAAEGASLAEVLERLHAAARNPAERAAATLLRARAAEGVADSSTAERLVHKALADQPDLAPALMDAGEYAACRGDLRAADRYLRQTDHPVAGSLHQAVRTVLAEPAATGRNQPCPCGSGRKYKACCLTSEAPLTVRAPLLYALMGTYGQRAQFGDLLSLLITRNAGNPHSVLLCLDLVLRQDGFTDRFLRARGGWLRDDERALVVEWSKVPIGLYEVREIRRGVGATLRSLSGGEPFFQRDRLFSTSVRRLDLLCGRLLTDGTRPRVLAIPAFLPRDLRRAAVDLFAAAPSAEQIATFLGPQPDPYLLNSDGHELCFSELTLEVPDAEPAWRRLTDELVQTDHHVLEDHAEIDGKTVSRATVSRTGRRWKLSANSRERLAALADRVWAVAPDATELSRQHQRMEGSSEGSPGDGRPVRRLVVDSYFLPASPGMDEQQAQEEMLRRHRESWLDSPVCDGLTPREAAKAGGEARVELEAMLDDMQWRNDRNRDDGKPITMDVDGIRHELGLASPPQTR